MRWDDANYYGYSLTAPKQSNAIARSSQKNSTDEWFRYRKVMQPKQLSTRTEISEAIGRIGITVKHYLIGLFDSRTTKITPTDGLCGKR
jgi:hypothetical protein